MPGGRRGRKGKERQRTEQPAGEDSPVCSLLAQSLPLMAPQTFSSLNWKGREEAGSEGRSGGPGGQTRDEVPGPEGEKGEGRGKHSDRERAGPKGRGGGTGTGRTNQAKEVEAKRGQHGSRAGSSL